MWLLLPCVSPGCGAVTGPGRVLGFLGETLSVTCTYQTCWETLSKFCCKPATSIPPTCAEDFVISSELKPEVQQGRFSIWNNHTHWAFRVTVEGLAKRDTGTVHCGVGTGLLQFDEIADVESLGVAGPPGPAWMCPPPGACSRGCTGGNLELVGAHAGGTPLLGTPGSVTSIFEVHCALCVPFSSSLALAGLVCALLALLYNTGEFLTPLCCPISLLGQAVPVAPGPGLREHPSPLPCQGSASMAAQYICGVVVLVLNWAWGAQTPFLQRESVLCMFWGGLRLKSLVGKGKVSHPSDLKVCPLDVAEGTQLLLL
uniref:Uncharacterized protein n=1 Tax=Corvus moneduloides TaxID=1196302 RepID=A0A8U7MVD9_CORMO